MDNGLVLAHGKRKMLNISVLILVVVDNGLVHTFINEISGEEEAS